MILKRLLILFCIAAIANTAVAQLKLPALISNGMILQRDSKVNIWGWANPGDEVMVTFNGVKFKAITDQSKKWKLVLPPAKAGATGDMIVSTKDQSITIKDILYGDVWLCSGQSNMEFDMSRVIRKYPEEIANSTNPNIRQFLVKRVYSFTVKDDVDGKWISANPNTVLQFSAVAYFMAKQLYDKYKVPIGILHSSWGGTPAEAWVSENGLAAFPNYLDKLHFYQDPTNVKAVQLKDRTITDKWYSDAHTGDQGLSADGSASWAAPSVDFSNWDHLQVPGFWKEQNLHGLTGVAWYKKEIQITPAMAGRDADLELGFLDDNDSTYFNGIKVGSVSSKYLQRVYHITGTMIKEGSNVITVRLTNTDGNGGFIIDKKYRLYNATNTVDLTGDWQIKAGVSVPALPVSKFTRLYYQPASLYSTMIAPIVNYTIKGAAWYQGEANTNRAKEYRTLLPAMINDWRSRWGQGDFSFLIVQLANYLPVKPQPSESEWAELREAQQFISKTVPNTGLAVIIDIGETNDVHPLNKKDVGARLAFNAEKLAYHEKNIVYSGPVYKSMKVDGNQIILNFDHVGGGLTTADGQDLKQFAIAGADHQFVWAKAWISGNQIIVSSDQVKVPVVVRYAWADNPAGCNLINKEKLPASPFRTDGP
jgi:sialate O-acetylesterase